MQVLYLTLFLVVLDQVTKLSVKGFSIPFLNFQYHGMYYGQSIPIIGDFFRLTYVENPGMAFGLDFGDTFKFWLTSFSLIATIGLIVYLYFVRKESLTLRVPLAMILGGAIGNFIDRAFYGLLFKYDSLFFGRVVDFFDFNFFNIEILGRSFERFPIFNIADISVTLGVITLLLFYKKNTEEIEKREAAQTEAENLVENKLDQSENLNDTRESINDEVANDSVNIAPSKQDEKLNQPDTTENNFKEEVK